jgi:DNA-binding transcriptional ArsR family regulator/protein-L-isoaspartate O-methyltransferase
MFERTASPNFEEVIRALKAAAEPTRLRLLELLQHAELTVGELCAILDQSQPRISRHLRLLTEAGLLERFREQQCVYYRAPPEGRYLQWLRSLLSLADPEASLLKHDRARATQVVSERQVATPESTPREGLAGVLLEELGPEAIGELLDIGTGSGLMLEILGPRARHAIGIDISTPALRLARTRVHGAGLAHCEFRRGDMYSLPYPDGYFDTVTLDRVLGSSERPAEALLEAARTLRADGRLIVVEDFDQVSARAADNPLAELRRWLARSGLIARRLRPCDLLDRHFIVALANKSARAVHAGESLNAAH